MWVAMSILEDHRRYREIIKGRIKQHFKKYVTQARKGIC